MYAHQRENRFSRLHAAAALAGTYTAFASLVFIDPKSFAEVPSQVLIPASILLPFCASFIAFVVFAPASFGLYWLMERFDRRNLSHHCVAGVVCVALTFALILLAGFAASLIGNAPEQIEETGLLGPAMTSQDHLLLAACAISGAAGGAAFYFARKVGSPGSSLAQTGGGRS
ncbi:hypothetical protein [Ensifer sp. B1-9]|uniref:hypothetical protein n=1 Tax=Ensifer sp. B1-9 TaxID=3141455 RepID=UPI003D1E01FC